MNKHAPNVVPDHGAGQGTLKSYATGFILSVVVTLAAYSLVVHHVFTGWDLVFALIALALVQLLIQLIFFLHLGNESKPRWNLIVFSFMMVVVLIVAIGTLWIMDNLDYNHGHTPSETDNSIIRDELIKP
ncbi:MAG: putative cytochrome ubiquinol oxidase chain cyoD [Candidatus Saccharibacteria bacterium]|nr:putative cytochrome ubiquinol oxidase chain cyoD [Candidatus Saccharibacteria bacterium]